tara:strand:+ start:2411 stop:3259 length:849 start_codon:yes stop_codon:yes gene_type:complete
MVSKTQNLKKGLYIVSTPIGNLLDITLRALEILKNSDIILCEDTRNSKKLLSHYDIKKKLISYHKFNEKKITHEIIPIIEKSKIISLISDAGTPTISDPGKFLINTCLLKNIEIIPIPGPSSVTSAISISGFSEKFIFQGFLPEKNKEFFKELENLKNQNCSIVIFIPPKKFLKNIENFKKYFSDREIVICREMTKIYEQYLRSKVKDLNNIELNTKGELTIILSQKITPIKVFNSLTESDKKEIDKMILNKSIKDILNFYKNKDISKKIIYDYYLKRKNEI